MTRTRPTDQIGIDLDNLYPNLPLGDVRRIFAAQIQPRKHVLDNADYTGRTRQHELDHTDQESICLEISIDHAAGTDDQSEMW